MEWRNIGRGKEKYLPMFDNASSIIVFDTETTGLGTTAKIIEFAAVRYQITPSGLHETHRIDLFINPEEKLEEKIIELTGITDRILEMAQPEVWRQKLSIVSLIPQTCGLLITASSTCVCWTRCQNAPGSVISSAPASTSLPWRVTM